MFLQDAVVKEAVQSSPVQSSWPRPSHCSWSWIRLKHVLLSHTSGSSAVCIQNKLRWLSLRHGFDLFLISSALNTLIPAPVGGEAGEAEDAHCRHRQTDLKPPDAKGAESTAASPNAAVADETVAG